MAEKDGGESLNVITIYLILYNYIHKHAASSIMEMCS